VLSIFPKQDLLWQDKLFITLAKSASNATDFFQIPTGRVVEVGTQVTV
jgi:KUP system potassium uptake protein